MGVCSSCLGRGDDFDETERQRLLADDPYAQPHHNYNAWQPQPVPYSDGLSPEERKRQEDAMANILRWAGDQIVDIFPINTHQQAPATPNLNSSIVSLSQADGSGMTTSQHQDILLSMIPGDKSKRSIRIYPASRPGTEDAQSVRSKASHTKLDGSMRGLKQRDGVFVKMNVDLP